VLALLQICMLPIIVRILGPNNYGLVGFSLIVAAVVMLLDQSISPVLSRELARNAGHGPEQVANARNLLRTLEIVSGCTGLVMGTFVICFAGWIGRTFIAPGPLLHSEVVAAVRLTGVLIIVQWPTLLYSAGFVGIQRQDILTAIRICNAVLAYVGTAMVLWLAGPSVTYYLGWLVGVAAATSLALGYALWRVMPASSARARFELASFKGLWRFAFGNLSNGLLGALLMQAPTLIVAKYCSLGQLAAYTLSLTLTQQIMALLTLPITATLMPRFAQIAERGDDALLAREYHRWTQVVVAFTLPVAGLLIAFAHPLLQIWLGQGSPLVDDASALLPLMAVGAVFSVIMALPFVLQLAMGWTRLSVTKNVIAVVVTTPVLLWLVPRYGPIVAACAWIAVNVGYYVFEVPLVHKRLLLSEKWRWWLRDTLLPLVAVTLVFGVSKILFRDVVGPWPSLIQAVLTAVVAMVVLWAILPLYRQDVRSAAVAVISWIKSKRQ
jgi:O-antigen/teichoic acid export membrane protein